MWCHILLSQDILNLMWIISTTLWDLSFFFSVFEGEYNFLLTKFSPSTCHFGYFSSYFLLRSETCSISYLILLCFLIFIFFASILILLKQMLALQFLPSYSVVYPSFHHFEIFTNYSTLTASNSLSSTSYTLASWFQSLPIQLK